MRKSDYGLLVAAQRRDPTCKGREPHERCFEGARPEADGDRALG